MVRPIDELETYAGRSFTVLKHLSILTVAFLLLTSGFPSMLGGTPTRQGTFDPSSMSLEQSVVWLRKTLLTIDISETNTRGRERYTQKLTYEITIADVDAGKFSVVEVEDHEHVKGFSVHIVMAAGKKAKTKQVLIENGKTTRKEFEYSDQEVYINSREKAYQTIEVLRRIVMLLSRTTSGKQPGGAAGSGTAEVRHQRTLTESFDKRGWWRTQTA
jgi:hypothetical protein